MNFWTGVHFFSFCVYTFAIFYVIIKNPNSVINWVLAMLFFYFDIWSACSFFLDNTGTGIAAAEILIKIQCVGWANFASYYFLFVAYLTNNKKLLSNPFFFVFLLISPMVFVLQNYRGEMIQCCRQVSYGLAAIWPDTPWSFAYFAFYTFMFISSTILLFQYRKKTRMKAERQVAGILLVSAVVVFTIGTIFSVVMNYMKVSNPVDANVVFLIFVGGFIYCTEKYELFTLSSVRNADRIMELINEGVLMLDSEGFMTTANRAALEIFGYPGGTETSAAGGFIENRIRNLVAGPAENVNTEITFRDAAGILKTVLISSRGVLAGRDGTGRICTIRDITGRKKAEVDLVDTVNELKRSNEELENFAYVASHDLKEPLRMVTSYVQLLRKKFMDKLGQDGNDYIDFASDGSKRMAGLIEGLLEYSRVKKAHRDICGVDTAAVVDKVLNTLRFKLQDKNAEVKVAGRLPVIKGEITQVEQLFQNIIGNALKFTSAAEPQIAISAVKEECFYKFTFMDNGIGIDMQYREKIFQIFQRLHGMGEYEGTGIGLAICRKIVDTHGGKIWVESEGPGKGSSFIFTLPAA